MEEQPTSTQGFSTARKLPKRRLVAAVVVVILIAAIVLGVLSLYHRPLPSLTSMLATSGPSTTTEVTKPAIVWSGYGDQYVTLTGSNLSAGNGGQSVAPTASTAKVMLALLLLQKKPLSLGQQGPSITVTSDVVAQYQQELALNESVVAVTAGEQITEYQALEAMLIPSATNIADMLANWGFGSISNYAAAANQYAATSGMTHTHFVDASGFAPGTVSTAPDLVKLGIAAKQNPVIAQIVAKKSVDLPVAGTVNNFNIELGISGIDGIKTGNTDEAGGAFLFSAPYSGQTIVGAIMHAPDLGTALHDAPEVLDSFKANIQTETPVKTGDVVATYTLPWGGTVDAVAQKQLSVTDWVGTKIALVRSAKTIKSNQPKGSVVGSVSFTVNGQTRTSPAVLAGSVPQPNFWWRVAHNHAR